MARTWTYCRSLFLISFAVSLVSCQKQESLSDKVKVTPIPEKPIVIDATITLGDRTINRSWFSSSFALQNKSSKVLVVRAIDYKVFATTRTGAKNLTATAVPEELNQASSFAILPPDESGYINYTNFVSPLSVYCADGTVSGSCDYKKEILQYIYIGGLPTRNETDSFTFPVTVELIGWFQENGIPKDRFSKIIALVTQ